ncbi:uncharacterized protein EV422DRAFT_521963 [Fimicolochytrium jonesii]|uniref:uncharacterized protein n=1 Tax=Fimicolochytrium jonesii TaxID=1396493 RepID=UPI0022FF36C4|nr:uncharacterized protein EV422DRAFT_521963 [Fimicolochytrium jonesii]KAI8823683.1 hypothetical protein EV422DRAFT_521963 [Fimicolochytrium jonesii]
MTYQTIPTRRSSPSRWLWLRLLLLCMLVSTVSANVEKKIFSPRKTQSLENVSAIFRRWNISEDVAVTELNGPASIFGTTYVYGSLVAKQKHKAGCQYLDAVAIANSWRVFKLPQSLIPHQTYEVRVCWAAITPADWSMDLLRDGSADILYLKLGPIAAGVSYSESSDLVVPYALALDRLLLGAIPMSTVPVGLNVVAAVAVGYFLMYPAFLRCLDLGETYINTKSKSK